MKKEPLFFSLKFEKSFGQNNDFEQYSIINIDENENDNLTQIYCNGYCFQGAIALLKSADYHNYSQMFHVYRKDDSEGIHLDFMKCFNEEGREIFIKNEDGKFKDCIFCTFEPIVESLHYGEIRATGSTITFFKNSGV